MSPYVTTSPGWSAINTSRMRRSRSSASAFLDGASALFDGTGLENSESWEESEADRLADVDVASAVGDLDALKHERLVVGTDDHADPFRLVERTDRAVHLSGRSC